MTGLAGNTALHHLIQFTYLQLLDVLTTVAFLMYGVKEANPVVRMAMRLGSSPLWGLLALKGFAMVLALLCLRGGRLGLLVGVNIFFAALVAWNLVALILNSVKGG